MSAFDWLRWNAVATASAAALYGFLLCLAIPAVRAWAGRVLAIPVPSTNQEIAALDAYRGFAASLVTMAHIWVFCQPMFNATQATWWHFLAVGGNKAVPMFVMLSGFLIYRAVKGIHTAEDLRRYALRRFLRVYPVYLFTLLLGYAAGQMAFDLPNFLSQVFMVRSITAEYLRYLNPPSWSLYVEVLFYAVLPVWVAAFGTRAFPAAAAFFVAFLFADPMGSRELWLWKYFFVGVMVQEFLDLHGHRISPRFAVFVFLSGCVLLAADMRIEPGFAPFDWFDRLGLVPKNQAEYTIGLAAACSLILIGTLRSPPVASMMSWKPLRVLGVVSFSLFLLHPFFILAVFPTFVFANVPQVQGLVTPAVLAPAWYAPFVMFPGAVAWAIACFLIVERPFLQRRPQ